LILQGEAARGVLAAVRSLGRSGWQVGVGGVSPDASIRGSRFCRWFHLVPALNDGLDAYVDQVSQLVRKQGYDVVLAGGDAEMAAISWGRSALDAEVPYPEHAVVSRALDKWQLHELAGAVGLLSPETRPATADALRDVNEPVLVKSRSHWTTDQPDAPLRVEATVADNATEAAKLSGAVRACGGEAVLQQLVPGQLTALSLVTDREGRFVAAAQQKATRIWPRRAGVSARAVTVPVEPELMEAIGRLFTELGWWGLAEVQFMATADGSRYLIDFNGRFYGSMQLAVAAGADLPTAYLRAATGMGPGPTSAHPATGRPDVHYQWFEGDLRAAWSPSAGVTRPRSVLACLAMATRSTHSAWSLADPAPGLSEASRLAGRARTARRGRPA
jgi:predicted ATP-grasp superfamily ATP-dependent carboligase